MPILFFRVGYMENYDGPGEIAYGGAYIQNNGEGGEMWNFRPEGGRCYGYVMTMNFAGIDLSRLDDTQYWNSNDEMNGIDIIFIAKNPPHGQVIVGWYRNATMFHRKYRIRRGNQRQGDWTQLHYVCEVDSENAILLPEEERTYRVPRGRGFPGTSNVWYADADNEQVAEFLAGVGNYIGQRQAPNLAANNNRNRRGGPQTPNKELITRIEQAAIDMVWTHYENMKNPYTLKSVEKDNCGWDLEASREGETLYLEVKGHLGNVIQFELTPNEYAKMKEHSDNHRVCVVRNALNEPDLVVFTPEEREESWFLVSNLGDEIVKLSEKIAARASQIE